MYPILTFLRVPSFKILQLKTQALLYYLPVQKVYHLSFYALSFPIFPFLELGFLHF